MLQVVILMMSPAILVAPAIDTERLLTSPTRHVRALTPELAKVVAAGVRRSRTFAQLITRLEYSDVIVQIVPSAVVKPSVAGRMLFVPDPRLQRFVRIEVRVEGTLEDLITILAHELRHAVEVADAPEVRDIDGLERLYRRIGHGSPAFEGYDTDAAIRTGRQVRAEISG